MDHVEAVPAAGEVDVAAPVRWIESIVRRVVDAAQRQRGAQLSALGRVVVDHVEDHLDADAVEPLHHGAELRHLAAGCRGVVRMRREEGDRVVPPVVREAALHQLGLGDEVVHRHQLDGGHAQREQVLEHGVHAETEVRSTQRLRHPGMELREPPQMALVDHRATPRRARRPVVAPAEGGFDDDALRHGSGAVAGAGRRVRSRDRRRRDPGGGRSSGSGR